MLSNPTQHRNAQILKTSSMQLTQCTQRVLLTQQTNIQDRKNRTYIYIHMHGLLKLIFPKPEPSL